MQATLSPRVAPATPVGSSAQIRFSSLSRQSTFASVTGRASCNALVVMSTGVSVSSIMTLMRSLG